MIRQLYVLLALVCMALASVIPVQAATAHGRSNASCPKPKVHELPASSGTSTTVVSFGVKGGSLRPWTVTFALDGAVTGTGIQIATQHLTDPAGTLKAILALADAEKFFALHGSIGCSNVGAAGPDTSAQTIAIHTSTGTKRVSVYGSCKANFTQVYDVLQQIAGVSR